MTTKKTKTAPLVAAARPKIRHHLTYDYKSVNSYEHPVGPSMTIPDEVLTPKQILDRFSRGLPLNTTNREVIYDEQELPDFETMDLAEIYDYHQDLKSEIAHYEQQLAKKYQDSEKQALKNQLREELRKELSEPTPEPPKPPSPPASGV